MADGLRYVIGTLSAGAAGFNLFGASERLADYITHIDSIRAAVYSRATEITPELIQQASVIADHVNRSELSIGLAQMVLAGVMGGGAYYLLRGESNPTNSAKD